jgi:Protein of unknown function (DUF3987)
MAKRPQPGEVVVDGDIYLIPFGDEISLEVRSPEHQEQRRKLMANVRAAVAGERVNDRTFDLKNGQRRIDYAAVAAHLDGRVDWVSCLMLAIEPLERAMAQQGQADASELSLTAPATSPVRPFPVEVFPEAIATLIRQGAAALPCAPDLIGVPMLAVLGTAIGTSYDVEMKHGWTEGPRIYSGVIALPGDKKSPAEKLATRPLHVLQAKHGQDFEAQQVQHDLAMLVYEVQLADWRSKRRKKADSQQPEGTKQPPPPKQDAPTMTQLLTVDATVEALASIISSNPRGVLMERDELTGWVLSMNQYKGGKGADRQMWLTLWNGASVVINRKGRPDPLVLSNPFVCVTGGLTPDCLDDLVDVRGCEDGFLPRILLAYPDQVPLTYTHATVTPEAQRAYEDLIKKLLALGQKTPASTTVATFIPEGRVALITFLNELYDRCNSVDCPVYLRHVIAKLEAYTGRLALILQLCRSAAGDSCTDNIEPESVRGAAELIRYFLSHAERIYPRLRTTEQDKQVEAAVSWIDAHGGRVSAREVQRHKVAGVKTATQAKALLYALEDRGYGMVSTAGPTRVLFTRR